MALDGKVALLTGAAQGLGKGFSEILLQNGAKVAILDRNEAGGKSLKDVFDKQYGPDKTLFVTCDVQSQEQFKAGIQKTIEAFGRIDIFCNNAGIIDERDWEKAISINLVAVVRGTYLAVEHMNKLTGGHGGIIINIGSMAGLGPLLSVPVYSATKHGVVGFTRSMADASKVLGYGIRLNTLCPAFVQTEILNAFDSDAKAGQFIPLAAVTKKMVKEFGMLQVSEVAKSFLQLVLDETRNGEALVVQTSGSEYMTFPTIKK